MLQIPPTSRPDSRGLDSFAWLQPGPVRFLVAAACLVGIAVRAAQVLPDSFPLNDGGLFYAMTRDLQANGFKLPSVTSYNQEGIPFAYPPLGFYVTGLLDRLTPLSLMDAFRGVPLVATCLTLPAFWLLARRFLGSGLALIAATFAFALIPRSYIWLLMGGGVTRSLGFLFAILALHQAHRLYTGKGRFALPATAALAALTVLSHLETGWFLAFSTGLLFLAFGRNRRGLADSLVLLCSVALVTAPWWLTVLSEHGTGPLLSASESGGSFFSDATMRRDLLLALARVVTTSEPLFPIISVLALLGALSASLRGHWFLPAWWVAIVLLDARAFPTFTTLPVALLAGVGVKEVLVPALQAAVAGAGRRRAYAVPVVLVAIVAYAGAASLHRDPESGEASFLRPLDEGEQAALRWVGRDTPQGSRFLVVPDSSWETASTSEWFPLLTRRVSVATVQGTEWLPSRAFQSRVDAYYEALDCGYKTAVCLESWIQETGLFFTHVYFRKWDGDGRCCDTLLESLAADSRYQLVYDGPGATVFEVLADRPAVTVEPTSAEAPAAP